ncbi:MAG: heavy metal translocating P-type ATPase metal-binding domain-containing protein [Opitutales bacterium]
MRQRCTHCGTPFQTGKGQGKFCCAGCEHVYDLIQDGGLESFYEQRDQVGQPVGDRPFKDVDAVSMNRLQEQGEEVSQCRLVLGLEGMSCMGCAWLVEQLARRHPGVLFAKAALRSKCLSLAWEPGKFSLSSLAGELRGYGFTLTENMQLGGTAVTPLAMRFGLTLIFSLNGLLLVAASGVGIGGSAFVEIYSLLIIVCLVFSLLIGGELFLRPVWRGLLLRCVHRDAVAAALLALGFLLALLSQLVSEGWNDYALLFFSLLPIMVLVRWQSEARALKVPEA